MNAVKRKFTSKITYSPKISTVFIWGKEDTLDIRNYYLGQTASAWPAVLEMMVHSWVSDIEMLSGAIPKHPSQLVWGFSPKQLSFDLFQRCLLCYGQTALSLCPMSIRYSKRLICSIIMLIEIHNIWFEHVSFWTYTPTLWAQQLQKQQWNMCFFGTSFCIKQSILELNLLHPEEISVV